MIILCLSFSHFRSKWRKTVKKGWFGKKHAYFATGWSSPNGYCRTGDTVWVANSLKSLGTGQLNNLVTERNRGKSRACSSRMSITYAFYALSSVARDDSVFESLSLSLSLSLCLLDNNMIDSVRGLGRGITLSVDCCEQLDMLKMSEMAPLWRYEKGSSDYSHGQQDGSETSDLMTSATSDYVVNRAFFAHPWKRHFWCCQLFEHFILREVRVDMPWGLCFI